MKKWIDERYLTPVFETDTNYAEWFGYYNYDVLNHDETKMLCNRVSFDGRSITSKDKVELGWYDITSGEWHHIDYSDSFNWQQGAMLQWLPGVGNYNKVIYNISKNNHFKSVISDISNGEKKVIDFPTYCVTPDGKYSISLNYERSYWCRAYHYQSVRNEKYDVKVAPDDGIFRVDLERNSVERIVCIQDVINLDPLDDFYEAKHWLEHIMLNSSGTRIAFLHRFTYVKGYTTRVCICDIDGNNLEVLQNWKHNFWSHLGWKGDNEFVIYTVKRESITENMKKNDVIQTPKKKLKNVVIASLKKCIPEPIKERLRTSPESYYQLYKYENGKFMLTQLYADKIFNIDGHPSFTKNGQYMLTDSYPDKKGMQRLLVLDTVMQKSILLGRFYAAFQGNPASCDLHPKLSKSGNYIVVDTAYSGKHKMCVYRIKWDKIKKDMRTVG